MFGRALLLYCHVIPNRRDEHHQNLDSISSGCNVLGINMPGHFNGLAGARFKPLRGELAQNHAAAGCGSHVVIMATRDCSHWMRCMVSHNIQIYTDIA
jgi:hypothetical protein